MGMGDDLDVALAASYLKRVSLSSSALNELMEEETSRKMRRVVSANGLGEARVRVPEADLRPDMRRVVSADVLASAAFDGCEGARGNRVRGALEASLDDLEETGSLGPVEIGRCREIAAHGDAFVRRGLADALANAASMGEWSELATLLDIHRRKRPYDLRDDLRRGIAAAKRSAIEKRVCGDTTAALEAMRELKKLQWQLSHVTQSL